MIRDHQVLTSEIPIQSDNGIQGVLNIFHDKTEMRKLSDQLSGAHYMLDTLRFFNHEFMNKLHIILGYLHTGQTQQAMQFIMNTSLVSGQSIRETADCVRVSRLCALIIGKMMHASESGILLSVSHDSYCREEDLLLPVEDCATIIGNLLENAIDALSRSQSEVKEIKLSLYCRPDCNIIVCEDTGSGISPNLIPCLWEKGVSSKGEGRGMGLYLVRQLVEAHRGTIDLETEPGEGTLFTLTFTQEKEGP
jgi:sensor histidine kinase regulating citrate/malate metabolism